MRTALERAKERGISLRDYVALGNADRHNVMDPMLMACGMSRWLDAGQPSPDLSHLEFLGADSVRAVVEDVLGRLPVAAAWTATEHVCFVEVGREAEGWMGSRPVTREFMVALNGKLTDEDLFHIAAHEIGHAFTAQLVGSAPTAVRRPRHEFMEALASIGATADDYARVSDHRAATELLADDLAVLWGFGRQYHELHQRRCDKRANAAVRAAGESP